MARATEVLHEARLAIVQPRMRRHRMPKTIRKLRDDWGEPQSQLADALGAPLHDIHDLETGIASPSVGRLRLLTEHFGVREEKITFGPSHVPTPREQLGEALTE